MPEQPGPGELGRQCPRGMDAPVVGVHDTHGAAAQEPGQARRLTEQEGGVGEPAAVAQNALARRRLEGNALGAQPISQDAVGLVQDDQRVVASPVDPPDQLDRRHVAAADRVADEREADDGRSCRAGHASGARSVCHLPRRVRRLARMAAPASAGRDRCTARHHIDLRPRPPRARLSAQAGAQSLPTPERCAWRHQHSKAPAAGPGLSPRRRPGGPVRRPRV